MTTWILFYILNDLLFQMNTQDVYRWLSPPLQSGCSGNQKQKKRGIQSKGEGEKEMYS